MAVSIITGVIQVNEFRNNSIMSQGKGVANGWSYVNKMNLAVGQVAGNMNLIPSGVNLIIDPDLFDANLPNSGGQSPPIGGVSEVV